MGRLVTAETTPEEIVRLMVGQDLVGLHADHRGQGDVNPSTVLEVQGLTVSSDMDARAVQAVSFGIRAGEILGIAGVAGNGQSELVEAIVGLRRATQGRVMIDGEDVTALSLAERRRRGVAYVPEDRLRDGLALDGLIFENATMGEHRDRAMTRWSVLIRRRALMARAAEKIAALDVRSPSVRVRARTLSGGNLQKVVLARELSRELRALVAAEPTRGLDVAATRFVHQRLLDERARGLAILLVSSELSEIAALADRAVVMLKGQVVGEFDPKTTTREQIGALMVGSEGDGR